MVNNILSFLNLVSNKCTNLICSLKLLLPTRRKRTLKNYTIDCYGIPNGINNLQPETKFLNQMA